MNDRLRVPLALGACLVAIALGWSTIRATRVDALAKIDPQAALRLDSTNPEALLRASRRQLRAGDPGAAIANARQVLARAPSQGDAFAVIAQAAIARGDSNASSLLSVAGRRAPRSSAIRALAAAAALRSGNLSGAMHQIDALLRLGGPRTTAVFLGLVTQAESPQFVEALADTLATEPPWRTGFMRLLGSKGSTVALDRVNAALGRRGELAAAETRTWLDKMLAEGRWGEAFARWLGMLDQVPSPLPLAYNGAFDDAPGNIGFDWHKVRAPGVATELEADGGASGSNAAHFRFLGLRAAGGDLELPLLLAPGRYRLSLRAHAEYLRSDQGLRWKIRCANGREIAATDALRDSFRWRTFEVDFKVPDSQCPGQWLALENPATAGAAQQVSGDLWTDDVRVILLPAP